MYYEKLLLFCLEFNTSDFMYGWNPGVAHNKTIQPFVCQYRGYRFVSVHLHDMS